MPTVWIANDGGHPGYGKSRKIAGEDAEIRFLTEGSINYHGTDRLTKHLAKGIARFVKEDDYLIPSGAIIINMIAFDLWLRQHRRCNVLLWHGGKREYELHEIKSGNMERQLERAFLPTSY